MKFTTSILLITLIASMSAYKLRADDGVNTDAVVGETGTSSTVASSSTAASTGACTKGSCGICEKNGAAKFCTTCYKSNITGTANNRLCDGSAPTGCTVT